MKTVNESDLATRIVTDDAEIRRLRWFQHHRYLSAGLLDHIGPRHLASQTLPDDPAVDRSTYFGVYRGGTIAATARIVRSGPMPMLDHFVISPEFFDRLVGPDRGVGEISRLAAAQTTPHYDALSLLAREFLRYGINNPDVSLLIASVERPLVRLLEHILGVPLHIVGDETDGYGPYQGAHVPILIDTAECLRTFTACDTRRSRFFTDTLVIDLTIDSRQPVLTS